MKQLRSVRALALGFALALVLTMAAAVQARSAVKSRTSTGALVALKKTALGTILVDARGRTLYLFEKDRSGVSMCDTSCATYWPPLTSKGVPRAGRGVHQSLLRLTRPSHGQRQVSYAGHPVYRFVGDKRSGQTAGEGLDNFGAEWYALAATGQKIDRDRGSSSGSGSTGGW